MGLMKLKSETFKSAWVKTQGSIMAASYLE